MKSSNQKTRFTTLLTPALLLGAWGILTADLHAAEQKEAPQKSAVAQRLFASPDESVKALLAAAESKDRAVLREIFGPEVDELLTGDKVQDANNAQRFATVLAQGCKPVPEGEGKIILEGGTNALVAKAARWYKFGDAETTDHACPFGCCPTRGKVVRAPFQRRWG